MKTIGLVYISLSGNTKSFIERLQNYLKFNSNYKIKTIHVKDLIKQNQPFTKLNYPFITFLPTYLEGGNGIDSGNTEILTTPLKDFIAYQNNYKNCLGIVGFGNKNFNHQYCLTAKQYSEKFNFPVLNTVELRGMQNDVERIGKKIINMFEN